MSTLTLNSDMPYMPFNWAEHDTRTNNLTLEERGMFDRARCALWRVVDCRMPLDTLKLRLRAAPGSDLAALIDTLVGLDLLTVDVDGYVGDAVQVREFAEAVQKAATNRANGAKGGRPRRQPDPSPAPTPSNGTGGPDF